MRDYRKYFDSCVYTFDGKKSVLENKDIGICSDVASICTSPATAAGMNCMQGCPYTNTAFNFEFVIDGNTVKCDEWKWLPAAMLRYGKNDTFALEVLTGVVPGTRTVIEKITVTNLTDSDLEVPVAVMYRGFPRKEDEWAFSIPTGWAPRCSYTDEDGILTLTQPTAVQLMTTSMTGMRLFDRAYLWENDLKIAKGESVTIWFSVHLGEAEKAFAEARETRENYEAKLESVFDYLDREVKRIYDNLPRLKSDKPLLDNLYYRSLVTYIMCRWENPDLCAIPYFSTGSINGGCMCSYLWDYCGGLMMHPIYDTYGNKQELLAYLRNDLTTSYALNPVTSFGVGPWYQINQEKIILMVYHHIRATGEIEFLFQEVAGKTVIEWMRYYAYVCDDVTRDVELYDYGIGGNAHLEINQRGNGPYNGVIPDLNARRYLNYMRVYELTKIAGCPDELLPKRAAALKEKLKELWNEDAQWYDFIDADGNRDIRYTVQMFKFINSGVIDKKEREGLISHLNDREFLSKFGLHSMSKLDTQYDQDDIDNGGGGICTHFTMQICAQLYEMGYDALATDILERVYWWGDNLPYMGDSCAANMIRNREDTPLQGDISSVSCAQMIFFYIFGINPRFDGTVDICPVKVRPAENMRVDNVRLCGKVFSVSVEGDKFTVTEGDKSFTAKVGETVTLLK
jgi:hypothetical protein